jgi:hypothetical protein
LYFLVVGIESFSPFLQKSRGMTLDTNFTHAPQANIRPGGNRYIHDSFRFIFGHIDRASGAYVPQESIPKNQKRLHGEAAGALKLPKLAKR